MKLFFREAETEALSRVLSGGQLSTSRLSLVEISSALCRRCRNGELSLESRDHILDGIRQQTGTFFLIAPSEEILNLAQDLLRRNPLRAADSIQLASALTLRKRELAPLRFVCFDRRLNEAASREDLPVHSFG